MGIQKLQEETVALRKKLKTKTDERDKLKKEVEKSKGVDFFKKRDKLKKLETEMKKLEKRQADNDKAKIKAFEENRAFDKYAEQKKKMADAQKVLDDPKASPETKRE